MELQIYESTSYVLKVNLLYTMHLNWSNPPSLFGSSKRWSCVKSVHYKILQQGF